MASSDDKERLRAMLETDAVRRVRAALDMARQELARENENLRAHIANRDALIEAQDAERDSLRAQLSEFYAATRGYTEGSPLDVFRRLQQVEAQLAQVTAERDEARAAAGRLAVKRNPLDPSSYSMDEAERIILDHHAGMAACDRSDSLERIGHEDVRQLRLALRSAESDWRTALAERDSARALADIRGREAERVERERDAYRSMLCDLLASAHPHPKEHPTMAREWDRARHLLKTGELVLAGAWRKEQGNE